MIPVLGDVYNEHLLFSLPNKGHPTNGGQSKLLRDAPILKNVNILVATITGKGDNPRYSFIRFILSSCSHIAFAAFRIQIKPCNYWQNAMGSILTSEKFLGAIQ